MSIRDTDLGYKDLIRRLSELAVADLQVQIGILGDQDSEVLTRAAANEFGTDTIPERSFLRSTVDENQSEIAEDLGLVLGAVVDGTRDLRSGMELLGLKYQDKVKAKVVSLRTPANADSTIAAKGSSNPLIDTGEMLAAITSAVVDAG